MQVDFYHLAGPVDAVLPRIAERIVAGGGRLLIVAGEEAVLARLDTHLWSYAPASFLPHGREGDQPVLLSAATDAANGARNIALVDGVWRDEALTFDRAFHFFDDESIDAARAAWRSLSGRDGVEPRYWKQGDRGGWEQVA